MNTIYHILLHPWVIVGAVCDNIRWAWQRVFHGWDDRAAYGISWYLTKTIPELIDRMKEYGNSYPGVLTPEKWDTILDEIADGFRAGQRMQNDDYPVWNKLWASGWDGGDVPNPDEFWPQLEKERAVAQEKFYCGMELFVKWFWDLWD